MEEIEHEEINESSLSLPISRIKKIIKIDPEHISSTESANYLLGMATELFVLELTNQAALVTKSKHRKKIQYTDFQKVVNSEEAYAFMRDLVPKRAPIGELVKNGIVKVREDDTDKLNEKIVTEGVKDLDEEGIEIDNEEEVIEKVEE